MPAIPLLWFECIWAGSSAAIRTMRNAYAASAFYSVDRFASYKMKWGEFYREGGIVIADRYTTSNAVHQCPPSRRRSSGRNFWIGCSILSIIKSGISRPGSGDLSGSGPGGQPGADDRPLSGRRSKKGHTRKGYRVSGTQPAGGQALCRRAGLGDRCLREAGGMRTIQQIHEDVLRATKEILC